MGERELRNRLADDGEQRATPFELGARSASALARAQRVGRPRTEGREGPEHSLRRRRLAREEKLDRPHGRLTELESGRDLGAGWEAAERLGDDRTGAEDGTARHFTRKLELRRVFCDPV